jgi:transcriptional regulator with XRE-family HTH domain
MARGHDPLFQRRRLRGELRRLRARAKETQRDAAQALEWSPSKLIRIETGAVGVSITDLRAMLAHYGVTDKQRIEDLVESARASRRPAWWSKYRDLMDPKFQELLGFEGSASIIRAFNPLLVPGLLQTEDYARALIEEQMDVQELEADPGRADRIVQARLERQALLVGDDSPQMFFILDEAVLRRRVGGTQTMLGQLQHLKELALRPRIDLQVVSFNVGAYSGLWGPFVVFELDDYQDEFTHGEIIVFLENAGADYLIRDDPEQSTLYVERFFRLEQIASPKGDAEKVLDSVIEQMSEEVA